VGKGKSDKQHPKKTKKEENTNGRKKREIYVIARQKKMGFC